MTLAGPPRRAGEELPPRFSPRSLAAATGSRLPPPQPGSALASAWDPAAWAPGPRPGAGLPSTSYLSGSRTRMESLLCAGGGARKRVQVGMGALAASWREAARRRLRAEETPEPRPEVAKQPAVCAGAGVPERRRSRRPGLEPAKSHEGRKG